jgi:hypothetical protein
MVIGLTRLLYKSWLHFVYHYDTQTSVHSHIFTIRCSVVASNGGRFTYSGFPKYPPTSVTSFEQQQLKRTEPQQSSSSLTYSLTNSLHFIQINCSNAPTNYFTQMNSSELAPLIVLLITYTHGSHRTHHFSVAVSTVTCSAIGEDHAENTAFHPVFGAC